MDRLNVIKIGGNIIDDAGKLAQFLEQFALLPGKKILVHGGGKLATKLAERLGIPQQIIDGRRITDRETLEIVTMVYAGSVNKQIVAILQRNDCNAVGISGADGNAIQAHKRINANVDYGFAGDIDDVNASFIADLLTICDAIVVAPITHDKDGQLLNTNADTIAQELATAMSSGYAVNLVYSFERAGVLMNAEDDSTVIPHIDPPLYEQLKSKQLIFAGMIPKLDNAFAAIAKGVEKVIIGKADQLSNLVNGKNGTAISGSLQKIDL